MSKTRTLIAVLAAALASAAGAAAQEGDLYAAIRGKLEVCAICHGAGGASEDGQFPILAGQHLHYLYVQLKDFKSGRRESEVMAPVAADLERVEMLLLAQYFSEQAWPAIAYRADPAKAAVGESAVVAGQCVQCHLGGFEGNSGVPRVAGQYPEYLEKTMRDYKTRTRNNAPDKSTLLASFSDEQIAGLAALLGGI
jgi:cytochrome c553